MADRMLDKISKVLKQAENASTPEEAAAYMQKAQELASTNSIDLAIARAHQADKEKRQVPEKRIVRLDPREGRWRMSPSTKWKCELFLAVAAVNDVQCLISRDSATVFPYGFPGDLDVVEALYNSLVIQMVAAADDGLARGSNKEVRRAYKKRRVQIPEVERAWGEWSEEDGVWYDVEPGVYNRENHYALRNYQGTCYPPPKTRLENITGDDGEPVIVEKAVQVVDGRVWRANFYQGFISRIRSRLWEAQRTARKSYDEAHAQATEETGLVLRSKALEVDDYLKADVGDRKLGVHHGADVTQFDYRGQDEGRTAGANARLGTEVRVESSKTKAVEA